MRLRVLLLLTLPTLLCAQSRNAVLGWWDNPVTSGLDLSDLQERQIRQVVHEYRNRLVDARAAVEKAENDLEDVFDETVVDQARGDQVIERLVNARAELTKAVSEMTLRLRAVLTTDQWQELQRREKQRTPGRDKNRRSPRNLTKEPVHPEITTLQ